jgi:hypothetical protein
LRIYQFDSIAEASELSDHFRSPGLLVLFADSGATFIVMNSLVEDLPDETTLPMGNRPDSLFVSEARYCTTIDNLKDSSFSLDCGVGSLIENAPHVTVALRRPMAIVDSRALIVPGTCTNPRGETFLGRKCRCGGTHFGDDLLCRIDA